MKKYFVAAISLLFFITFCKTQKNITQQQTQQGIEGYVQEYSGNFMPQLNKHGNTSMPQPKPLATTVYIYEATNIKDVVQINHTSFYSAINKKLIKTIQSDSAGYFKIKLSVGVYSLFIKQNGNFYANSFDEKNNIQIVKVTENNFTKVNIRFDANATY